jgi:hypothetical protein
VTNVALKEDLPVGTQVMAPLGRSLHRAVVTEPPAGRPPAGSSVYVRFDPPVKAAQPGTWTEFLTCDACRLDLGWIDTQELLHVAAPGR